ncbi:CAP domain-containing protein [Psychrobacillus antarcticus]|uniref:CAP domain-containing protein n=1 Tax=Psychrobacillus antarcticus TaxID=2879115 RepID=UPI00240780F7|nr:CAP domain-containing protein [Psychrobacillus antarcticus]
MNKKHTIMAGILASGLLISANTASASMNTEFSPTTSEAKTSVSYKWEAPNSFNYNVKWDSNMQVTFAKLLNLTDVSKIINQVEKKPVVIDKDEKTPLPVVEKPAEPVQKPEVVTPAKPVEEKPEVVTPAKPVEEKPAVKEPVAPVQEPVVQEPVVQKPAPEVKEEVKVTSEIQQVVNLTNQERAKAGLQALQIDTKLTQSAQAKSQDMKNKNYFSHTSPTYGSPFDQMKSMGITYKSAAENIAMGQRTPAEVVEGWMNSPGHKANIMNASFTHIGVGLSDSGYYWTQQFIGK